MTAEQLAKNFERMVITSEQLKKFSNGRPERLNGRSKNFLWMAFFYIKYPWTGRLLWSLGCLLQTFWQPWACVFFISGENTMTKEEFQKMKQELEA